MFAFNKTSLNFPVIFYRPFQCRAFVVVPYDFVTSICIWLEEYGLLNNSCPSCFPFCFVLNLRMEIGRKWASLLVSIRVAK